MSFLMEREKKGVKNEVFINLDKKRRLKYSIESYQEILRNLQIPRGNAELVEQKLNRLDLRYLSVFLWAGLNWEDPLLHLVRVENMLVQYGKNPDKLKELEKSSRISQDITNCRVKKVVTLASSLPLASHALQDLTQEERTLYYCLHQVINEWRKKILERGENNG